MNIAPLDPNNRPSTMTPNSAKTVFVQQNALSFAILPLLTVYSPT
jgi:hypothetical protein